MEIEVNKTTPKLTPLADIKPGSLVKYGNEYYIFSIDTNYRYKYSEDTQYILMNIVTGNMTSWSAIQKTVKLQVIEAARLIINE